MFSYARGFAPCIPRVGWEAALEVGGEVVFDRGGLPRAALDAGGRERYPDGGFDRVVVGLPCL